MSADKNDHSPESHDTDHLGHEGHNHGSFKSYMIGFVLSVILTAIPFWLVMTGVLPTQATALIVMGFAVARSSLAKSPRAPRFICSSTTSIRPSVDVSGRSTSKRPRPLI